LNQAYNSHINQSEDTSQIYHDNIELIKKVKRETNELTEMLSTLELHLKLLLPRKFTTSHFNESVIEEILGQLKLTSVIGDFVSTNLNDYLSVRALKVKKKYKIENCEIEDHDISLVEFDHDRNVLIQRWLTDLEQIRIVLYDLINKNVSDFIALKIIRDSSTYSQLSHNTSYFI